MVDILKQLSLSPRGPGAFALSQTPRIDSACAKQLSYSIITTIPASLIFLSVVFSAIQGISRSFDLNLCYTYAQGHLFNLIGGSGASSRLEWHIGSNN